MRHTNFFARLVCGSWVVVHPGCRVDEYSVFFTTMADAHLLWHNHYLMGITGIECQENLFSVTLSEEDLFWTWFQPCHGQGVGEIHSQWCALNPRMSKPVKKAALFRTLRFLTLHGIHWVVLIGLTPYNHNKKRFECSVERPSIQHKWNVFLVLHALKCVPLGFACKTVLHIQQGRQFCTERVMTHVA